MTVRGVVDKLRGVGQRLHVQGRSVSRRHAIGAPPRYFAWV